MGLSRIGIGMFLPQVGLVLRMTHPNALSEGKGPWWTSLYCTLIPRVAGDRSWQFLHGAIATGMSATFHGHS